jgi:acetylornithine deacetylase/succinyl-diaminopimelate desuccinylase-like protein
VSSYDTELFRIIERQTKAVYPESLTLPHLVIYAMNSCHFRRRGAICYGIFPSPVTFDEYRSIHGHNERIREESLRKAVLIHYNVVQEFCRSK